MDTFSLIVTNLPPLRLGNAKSTPADHLLKLLLAYYGIEGSVRQDSYYGNHIDSLYTSLYPFVDTIHLSCDQNNKVSLSFVIPVGWFVSDVPFTCRVEYHAPIEEDPPFDVNERSVRMKMLNQCLKDGLGIDTDTKLAKREKIEATYESYTGAWYFSPFFSVNSPITARQFVDVWCLCNKLGNGGVNIRTDTSEPKEVEGVGKVIFSLDQKGKYGSPVRVSRYLTSDYRIVERAYE
jgi:hypothetical protein